MLHCLLPTSEPLYHNWVSASTQFFGVSHFCPVSNPKQHADCVNTWQMSSLWHGLFSSWTCWAKRSTLPFLVSSGSLLFRSHVHSNTTRWGTDNNHLMLRNGPEIGISMALGVQAPTCFVTCKKVENLLLKTIGNQWLNCVTRCVILVCEEGVCKATAHDWMRRRNSWPVVIQCSCSHWFDGKQGQF